MPETIEIIDEEAGEVIDIGEFASTDAELAAEYYTKRTNMARLLPQNIPKTIKHLTKEAKKEFYGSIPHDDLDTLIRKATRSLEEEENVWEFFWDTWENIFSSEFYKAWEKRKGKLEPEIEEEAEEEFEREPTEEELEREERWV